MTDEQRNQFRTARKAIDECWIAIDAVRGPFGAITPDNKIPEWNEAFTALIKSLNDVADLVEAEENLQILQTLPERE
jgi:lysophospholipase L1-like esterase